VVGTSGSETTARRELEGEQQQQQQQQQQQKGQKSKEIKIYFISSELFKTVQNVLQ